jgi:hypothetical protein
MHVLVKMPQADMRVYYTLFKQRRYVRSSRFIHISATSQMSSLDVQQHYFSCRPPDYSFVRGNSRSAPDELAKVLVRCTSITKNRQVNMFVRMLDNLLA